MCPFWLRRFTITFTLLFGYYLLLGRQSFTELKGRETLSRSHSDLNFMKLTASISTSTEIYNVWKFKRIVFETFDF
jgi:hypothetical protein